MTAWRWAAMALAVALYALASHLLMVHAAAEPWAVAVLCGPLLLAVLGLAWRRRDGPSVAAALVLMLVTIQVVAHGGIGSLQRLYVLQHAGVHLAIGWVFAITLRRGAVPLVTALAERVHRQVTPALRRYTRQVTLAWSLYFAAMAAASIGLFAAAPWSWWSAFANLLTPLSLAGMFAAEHLLRYRLHPEFERISIVRAVAAYRRVAQAPEQAR